jgi:hypothetical protein
MIRIIDVPRRRFPHWQFGVHQRQLDDPDDLELFGFRLSHVSSFLSAIMLFLEQTVRKGQIGHAFPPGFARGFPASCEHTDHEEVPKLSPAPARPLGPETRLFQQIQRCVPTHVH